MINFINFHDAAERIARDHLDVPDYIEVQIRIKDTNIDETAVRIYLIDGTGFEGYVETTTIALVHTALRMDVEAHNAAR